MVQKPSDKLENKVDPAVAAEVKAQRKSAIPANVKKPSDHLSAKADVVDGRGVIVEFEGHEYTALLSAEEVGRNLDLVEQLSEGNLIPPMKAILGGAQWFKFKNDFRDPETGITDVGKAREFFEVLMDAMKLGNS